MLWFGKAQVHPRTLAQIREHYEVEKALAHRLRSASREERRHLYSSVYDELYRCVPHHPCITAKGSSTDTWKAVSAQMRLLRPYLRKDAVVLEVGAGDCSLAVELAKYVRMVYAVEVSEEIARRPKTPENFELILTDGISIPLPDESVDIAYSNQLMEHLHPDDAYEQLRAVYAALARGGVYICATPNRLSGPHDISSYFDATASGFHLKEYTNTELCDLFRKVGFTKVRPYIGVKGVHVAVASMPIVLFETLLGGIPYPLRKSVAQMRLAGCLLGIKLVGTK